MDTNEIKNYLQLHHKKYKSFKDFITRDQKGQHIASKVYRKKIPKKIIYTYFKKKKYGYSIKECIEVAKKCKNRTEMQSKYAGYYDRVVKKKWNNLVFKYLPLSYKQKGYTFKQCKEVAKQCKNRYDMATRFKGYYHKAYLKKWIPRLFKINYHKLGFTYKQCRAKAKLCQTRKEFEKKFKSYYTRASNKKWLDDICHHMVCGLELRSISFIDCKKAANKCKSRSEFSQKFPSEYNRARKKKWFNEINSHMVFILRNNEQKQEKKLNKILNEFSKILFKQTIFKDYRAKPDFIIEYKSKVYIIELKDDSSYWSKKKLQNQIQKYNKLGKAEFKSFEDTIIVSPKGKYGISFAELQKNFN